MTHEERMRLIWEPLPVVRVLPKRIWAGVLIGEKSPRGMEARTYTEEAGWESLVVYMAYMREGDGV